MANFSIKTTAGQDEGLAWVVAQRNAEIATRNADKRHAHEWAVAGVKARNAELPANATKEPMPATPEYEADITAEGYLVARVSDMLNDYLRQKVRSELQAEHDAKMKAAGL